MKSQFPGVVRHFKENFGMLNYPDNYFLNYLNCL